MGFKVGLQGHKRLVFEQKVEEIGAFGGSETQVKIVDERGS